MRHYYRVYDFKEITNFQLYIFYHNLVLFVSLSKYYHTSIYSDVRPGALPEHLMALERHQSACDWSASIWKPFIKTNHWKFIWRQTEMILDGRGRPRLKRHSKKTTSWGCGRSKNMVSIVFWTTVDLFQSNQPIFYSSVAMKSVIFRKIAWKSPFKISYFSKT